MDFLDERTLKDIKFLLLVFLVFVNIFLYLKMSDVKNMCNSLKKGCFSNSSNYDYRNRKKMKDDMFRHSNFLNDGLQFRSDGSYGVGSNPFINIHAGL